GTLIEYATARRTCTSFQPGVFTFIPRYAAANAGVATSFAPEVEANDRALPGKATSMLPPRYASASLVSSANIVTVTCLIWILLAPPHQLGFASSWKPTWPATWL